MVVVHDNLYGSISQLVYYNHWDVVVIVKLYNFGRRTYGEQYHPVCTASEADVRKDLVVFLKGCEQIDHVVRLGSVDCLFHTLEDFHFEAAGEEVCNNTNDVGFALHQGSCKEIRMVTKLSSGLTDLFLRLLRYTFGVTQGKRHCCVGHTRQLSDIFYSYHYYSLPPNCLPVNSLIEINLRFN